MLNIDIFQYCWMSSWFFYLGGQWLPQGIFWVDHRTSFILGHFVLLTFSYLNKVFFYYYILEFIVPFSYFLLQKQWLWVCVSPLSPCLSSYLQSWFRVDFSISFCAVISSIHTICLFSSIFPCAFTFLTLKAHLSLSLVFLGWHCSGKLFRASALWVAIKFWLSVPHPSPAFSLGAFLG